MAFCNLQWHSKVLDKQVETHVILPEVGKPPFATFYLLHGLSDNHTMWRRRTRVEWYVRNLPLIVVMPDGFRGFYTNNEAGPAYAKYIGEELVQTIERNFPARSSRSARCIGGLSMGGYGAVRIGLGYPKVFGSVNSHSGALMAGRGTYTKPEQAEFRRIFGAKPAGSEHDLVYLAQKAKRAGNFPKLRVDCGTEDFLLEDSRQFHAALNQMKVPHDYFEYPGEHNWDYWEIHIQDALEFHAKNLKIKQVKNG